MVRSRGERRWRLGFGLRTQGVRCLESHLPWGQSYTKPNESPSPLIPSSSFPSSSLHPLRPPPLLGTDAASMSNPLIFQTSHPFPAVYNEQQLHLLQYNTAYFNPYEVKHRKRTSRAQLTVLEATFQQNNKPSSAVKKALAAQLDMPIRNVQVWFQNRCAPSKSKSSDCRCKIDPANHATSLSSHLPSRRAKDKNLALKARAKAEQELADGGAGTGNDSSSDAEKGPARGSHSPDSATTPADSTNSLLSPPANLGLRRGSAPSLGLASSPVSSGTSTFRIHTANPINNRSTSDSIRQLPATNPLNPFDAPSAAMLARRKSLPSFHPSLQLKSSQPSRLPTVTDSPHSPETDTSSKSPEQTPSNESGHGGVYRSASSTRLGSMPYPHPARGVPNYNYRSGSTPGTGVFRIPANPNPNPIQPTAWGLPGTATDDASGLKIPAGDTISQPFTFPPRPYSDVPGTGPLPSKDFRFGDAGLPSRDGNSSGGSGGNDEEDERLRALAQRQRFGSFASDLSVESDATGTTATTATSSTGFSPVVNPFMASAQTTAPSGAFRSRYPGGLGLRPSFGHANTDMGYGSSISYGMGSGSVASTLR